MRIVRVGYRSNATRVLHSTEQRVPLVEITRTRAPPEINPAFRVRQMRHAARQRLLVIREHSKTDWFVHCAVKDSM